MKTLVIDASVGIKWFLEDEEEVTRAKKILITFGNEEVKLLLPTLWIYEVANGIRAAVFKKRIDQNKVRLRIRKLKQLKLPLIDPSFLIEEIMKIAFGFNLSIYDASYVALAKENNVDFVTGDKKLYNKLKNKFPFVKWIGDYRE